MEENTQNEGVSGKKTNNFIYWGIIGVVILLIFGGFYFTSTKSENPAVALRDNQATKGVQTQAMEDQEGKTNNSSIAEDSEVKIINVEAGSFSYKPNIITVKKGEKVKIVMTAVDMMHDFNADELEIKLPLTKSGNTSEVEFTANEAGEFEYYCSVGQHRANGQVGKLIVTE